MSDATPNPSGPGVSIPEVDSMTVAHMGGHEYRVLSNGDARPTAYVVDIKAMTCTCPDHKYRRDGNPEVCKHVAKALLVAPSELTLDHHAAHKIFELLQEGAQYRETGATDEEVREAVDAMETDEAADSASSQASSADAETTAQEGVPTVREWLEPAVPAMEHLDVRAGQHDGRPGVIIEPDNRAMTETQWSATKGVISSPEWTEPHVGFGDDPCNICGESDGEYWYFVNNDDLEEVPA